MDNPLSFNPNVLRFIDSLQDEKTLKALSSFMDVGAKSLLRLVHTNERRHKSL